MKTFITVLLSIILLIGCEQANTKNTGSANEQVTQQAVVVSPSVTADTVFTFNNCRVGNLPVGWSQYATGNGEKTEWKVTDDNGNNVLSQLSSHNPNYHFNVVVYDGLEAKNVVLEVKIKGVAGKMDQGGGFVWRFTDADNYYVVRENPLEDNVVLYKVENGRRTDLPLVGKGRTYGVDVKPLGNGWNTLKLIVQDDLFTVYLNGEELFKVKDETFKNAGKIGLWTKADAVSDFDDLHVTVTDPSK